MKAERKNNKPLIGLLYGAVSGLAFAIFAWGIDAWLLAQANAAFFWAKFLPGLIICILAASLTGWLTIRIDRHGAALLLWGLLALLFSWLVTWLPLDVTPGLIRLFDPGLARWLEYSPVDSILQFRAVALVVAGFAAIISGVLEINLVENAHNSPTGLATGIIILVCVFLFGLAGSASDQLLNMDLRQPILAIDHLLQFAADHQGEEVPPDTARKIHLSAVTGLQDLLQKPRQLTLISFDPALGMMDILINFDGTQVRCTAIHAQPTYCVRLTEAP